RMLLGRRTEGVAAQEALSLLSVADGTVKERASKRCPSASAWTAGGVDHQGMAYIKVRRKGNEKEMTTQADVNWDLFNPFPWYQRKRAEAPVFYDEQHQVWHVFRYDDVQRALSDYATFSSQMERRVGQSTEAGIHDSLISTDPPRHRQLRA